MTEHFDEQAKNDLIRYRFSRANEALEEAVVLGNTEHFNAAMNRLYYACFYANMALLLKDGITATTHAGVKTMLGLHFVSKGSLSKEHGKFYSRLFEIRHSGDYDDFAYCDKDMFDEFYPKTVEYIAAIKEITEN